MILAQAGSEITAVTVEAVRPYIGKWLTVKGKGNGTIMFGYGIIKENLGEIYLSGGLHSGIFTPFDINDHPLRKAYPNLRVEVI